MQSYGNGRMVKQQRATEQRTAHEDENMIMGNDKIVSKTRFPGRGTSNGDNLGIRFRPPSGEPSGSSKRKRIGLALSCGGAKGLAHVGVIRTLEELGIRPDLIAGSSMGAYVAALWGKGHDFRKMEEMALEHRGLRGVLSLVDPSPWPIGGLLRGRRLEKGLRKRLGGARFEELEIPIVVSGTHMDSLEADWFDSGDVASAVRASCSLPGVFAPAKREGERYVDGGIAVPLPVKKLREMGAEVIIASNVLVPPERRMELAERQRAMRAQFAKRHPVLSFLNRSLNPIAFGNAPQVLDRCVQVGQARELAVSLKGADVVIDAYSFRSRWYEFHKPERFLALGRRAALAKAPALLAATADVTEKARTS